MYYFDGLGPANAYIYIHVVKITTDDFVKDIQIQNIISVIKQQIQSIEKKKKNVCDGRDFTTFGWGKFYWTAELCSQSVYGLMESFGGDVTEGSQ